MATLLGSDETISLKYLHVSPGFGKTWVIIMYALLLEKRGRSVCIVTVDEALKV